MSLFEFWSKKILESRKRNPMRPRNRRIFLEQLEGRILLANQIIVENQLPGTPQSVWGVAGAGDTTLQGFATDISVDHGQTVNFKINDSTNAPYHIDVYRMGYYGGMGARLVTTISSSSVLRQVQPAPLNDFATGLVDAGNWAVSASWAVPTAATSGIYFARLTRDDTAGASLVYFVVRDDEGASDLLFQTSDTTWEAYNRWVGGGQGTGNSLYVYGGNNPALQALGRATKVSYNRPLIVDGQGTGGLGDYNSPLHAEYPMVRWLESNGYNVSYTTDVDTDRFGAELFEHKVFMSVGHDEYWSGQQRANVEAAQNAGINLAFFSGNESYWKTRWESSIDGSGRSYRTLVTYKESTGNAPTDPLDSSPTWTWTGTWRDNRFSPPADGGRPENALSGTMYMNDRTNVDLGIPLTVSAADSVLRFWRNTSVASLAPGQTASLGQFIVGYETDEDVDNGFRPAGLIDMSSTTFSTQSHVVVPWGTVDGPGTSTHKITLYRASSGALVFSAGTVQWSWGLDGVHNNTPSTPDPNIQQATVNLLADMHVQPGSLRPRMVQALASTDTTAPTSSITFPTTGESFTLGTPVTITGTATDAGGGIVAGVEVSVDGGLTWHPAIGRSSWSYTWVPSTTGPVVIKTRATDDSGNSQSPTSTTVAVFSTVINASIWPGATPAVAAANDTNSQELGFKFRSDIDGYITGIRFYKGAGNTGTHVGHVWSNTGSLLASATFSSETASGWQQVDFGSPVAIVANTTYVASYYAPVGHYAYSSGYFGLGADVGALHALSNALAGGNGVYAVGPSATFPTTTFNATNYWVDVVFNNTLTPKVTSTTPSINATDIAPTAPNITVTFSKPVQPATILFTLAGPSSSVPATVSYNAATNTATLTPTGALVTLTSYASIVSSAQDLAGDMMAPLSWSFTTAPPDTTPPVVGSISPISNATLVSLGASAMATFSEPMQANTISFTLTGPSGPIAASVTYNAATNTAILTPTSALAPLTNYTANVSGALDLAGNLLASPMTWTFSTAAPITNATIWPSTATPAVSSANDNTAQELGFKFRSDNSGYITGLRFYKGAGNIGPHVGHLWSSSGSILATATFTNETASGWQQIDFASPVAISANTTYVASYSAPAGHYSYSSAYFGSSGTDAAPLHALSNAAGGGNGIYGAGPSGTFPTNSFNATNYWMDVVFANSLIPVVIAQSPITNATQISTTAPILSATFSKPVQPATIAFSLVSLSGAVATTVNYNSTTNTATWLPTVALSPLTTYTATLSGAQDYAGNTIANLSWSFSTATADTTPPMVAGKSPPANAAGVSGSSPNISVTFNKPVQPATLLFTLAGLSGSVASTISYDATTNTAAFTPVRTLIPSTTYTVTVSGAQDVAGNVMSAPVSWAFTTASAITNATIWTSTATPTVAAANDGNSQELGFKFRSDIAGFITGLRFYKGAGNTGSHVGHLWNSTGTLIASGVFTGETATGWQQVDFVTPVAIVANTTYVASYFAPVGHYAYDSAYFASVGVETGPG
jgi:hypothetical protein